MKKAILVAVLALTVTLTACKPATQIPSFDRVYTVDEFDRDFDLRQRARAACSENPGQLGSDPNCVNATASHLGAGSEEDHQYDVKRIAAAQDIATIFTALMLYHLDNGAYPTQQQGLQALIEKPAVAPVPGNWKDGGYLVRLPNDPFGHPYQFANPGTHGDIDVFSVGANGSDLIGTWQPLVHQYVTAARDGSNPSSDSQ